METQETTQETIKNVNSIYVMGDDGKKYSIPVLSMTELESKFSDYETNLKSMETQFSTYDINLESLRVDLANNSKSLEDLTLALHYLDVGQLELANTVLHHKYDLTNLVPQVGEVTLTNSKNYPFNDSETVITLKTPTETTDYRVEIEVLSGENIGTINVTDKQLNGFKVAFTGSCTEAKLKYFVIGGY